MGGLSLIPTHRAKLTDTYELVLITNVLHTSKNIFTNFCLTKLSCTHQAHENVVKSGVKKTQNYYPPTIFKTKIF